METRHHQTQIKNTLFFLMIIGCFYTLDAQSTIENLQVNHYLDQKKGMTILGSWGLGNAIAGAIGASKSQGEAKYFHQMNLGWGIINLGIAGAGYYGAAHGENLSELQLLSANHKLKNILLFNTGLDVAYMVGGLYLMEKSKNTTVNPERLKGFGKSVLMQGAFLFLFDAGMVLHFNHQTKDILQLVSTDNGMGLIYKF